MSLEAARNSRWKGPGAPRSLANVSIVIPVGDGETLWQELLSDLEEASVAAEVILIAQQGGGRPWEIGVGASGPARSARWHVSPSGRARQMNVGAAAAGRDFLWFLHADTRLAPDSVAKLDASLAADRESLRYFDLAFLPDGPRAMSLNAWGARFRSRILGMPFGDQGLCLPRATFEELGGYDTGAPYGEDHLLVWSARRGGVPLRPVGAVLYTSARKYRERGWFKTTRTHLYLTARQAIPEALSLLRSRIAGRPALKRRPRTSDSPSS